jgi:hypothetical protein
MSALPQRAGSQSAHNLSQIGLSCKFEARMISLFRVSPLRLAGRLELCTTCQTADVPELDRLQRAPSFSWALTSLVYVTDLLSFGRLSYVHIEG